MKRLRWRWILPVLQVLLAVVLIAWGRAQERAHWIPGPVTYTRGPSGEEIVGWDAPSWSYVPPALQVCNAINFPALLVYGPVALTTAKPSLLRLPVLLVGVALLWFWLGRGLERRLQPGPRPVPRISPRMEQALLVSGALISAAVGGSVVLSYWGHTPLPHLAGTVWSIGFLTYFIRRLLRRSRAL